jgi:hypothetical protein
MLDPVTGVGNSAGLNAARDQLILFHTVGVFLVGKLLAVAVPPGSFEGHAN